MGETDVRMNNRWGFYSAFPEKYPDIKEEIDQEVWEHFSGTGHKIGGYAFFTQAVGNFFIRPDDLAKKDFSKVLYNWDCA